MIMPLKRTTTWLSCVAFAVFILENIYHNKLDQLVTECTLSTRKSVELVIKHTTIGPAIKDGFVMKGLPKQIFMLWDNGWTGAPPMQRACLESFRRHNSDFKIKALNLTEAERLIVRQKHYSDHAWHTAKIQAKSDIIRVELLAKYGGIWVDASIYCNEPLSNWLNQTFLYQGFLAYERKDKSVNENNSPWIASWFLAASKKSYMLQLWKSEMRKAWRKSPSPVATLGYYWLHRFYRKLVKSNTFFGDMFRAMPFLDAGGPHCFLKHEKPHLYKLKTGNCRAIRQKIIGK